MPTPLSEARRNSEAFAQVMREQKERMYADWLDQPIPALAGKTPRRPARSVRGRRELDILLKEMENLEAHLPEPERADLSNLRRELGM